LPRRPGYGESPEEIAKELHRLLETLPSGFPDETNALREEVRSLAAVLSAMRRFSRHRLSKLITAKGASERILQYLKLFVGEVVEGEELEVVSGIHEYPRRIRELRVQEGYRITTGVTREDLRPDQYILESDTPSLEEAAKWRIANQIRRLPGSGKSRMISLLKALIGQPVSGEKLLYVAKVKDMRRARELRTEDGWRISTRFTGRPDLPPNMYVLEGEDQLPLHDRKIDPGTYDEVLARDNYSCRKCGWNASQRRPDEKRQFVELHHIEHHKDGGQNNKENLVTLCNVHHDSAHRLKLLSTAFLEWLSAPQT
jgi:hypothetical protein